MQEKNMPRADFVTSIFLIAFGIAVTVLSMRMPNPEAHNFNPYSAPGVVPTVLGIVIGALGIVLLVRSLGRGGHRLGITGATIAGFFTSDMTRRALLTVLLSIIYAAVLLGRVPYELATGLYVFAFIVVFEVQWRESLASQWKRFAMAVLVAVLAAGVVGATFRYLFLINLPG